MHSGADVEAFTAALNRDIEGDNSGSNPGMDSCFCSACFFLFCFNFDCFFTILLWIVIWGAENFY